MVNWNPIGWSLLIGGFIFGVLLGFFRIWDTYWLGSFGAIFAGLSILVTNLLLAIWHFCRGKMKKSDLR